MICKRCDRVIPDGKLVCMACIERASHRAFLELQRQLLPRIVSGEFQLTLCRVNPYEHIQLIGERTHAWCGEPVSHGKRSATTYEKLERTAYLCQKCRAAIHALAAELEKEGKIHAVQTDAAKNSAI